MEMAMLDPFKYHPPTPETQPKYDAIRAAEAAVRLVFRGILTKANWFRADPTLPRSWESLFERSNDAHRAYYDVIEANAPASADTSAALRCVRLARMSANEVIQSHRDPLHVLDSVEDLKRRVHDQLTYARQQACAAVALAEDTPHP